MNEEAEPVVSISNLTVKYGTARKSLEAVSGLDLHVDRGEVVGFIGPNGAGKTTTIKTIMGFLFPTEGKVHVFGAPAGSLEARRRIGFLPEVANYYPFLTARETLTHYAKLQEIPAAERDATIARMLDKVGLSDRNREPLRTFSKGMLQRVGLAQAFLGNPDLLVLDEITSGLDPVARRDARQMLLEFKSQGGTAFFSSHELSEITSVCDRIVLLDEGKVIEERPLVELLESTRRFVTTAEGAASPPQLPAGASLRTVEGRIQRFVAETDSAQEQLMQSLATVELRVINVTQEFGSLEDYFVDVVGHKVT